MSSDVVLSNLCPIGTPESESSPSTSTTASDTGSASASRLSTPINSESNSASYPTSDKLPSNSMTLANEPCCSSGSSTNAGVSTVSASSPATVRGMSHPLRRLGRFVKAYLASDLLTGVLALFGFLGTLLVGLWGVVTARNNVQKAQ
jgi:hypothetical protein